jgi:hypothetical protein
VSKKARFEAVIRFGMKSSDQEPRSFAFETAAELDAFLKGVEESNGWMEYLVLETTYDGVRVVLAEEDDDDEGREDSPGSQHD